MAFWSVTVGKSKIHGAWRKGQLVVFRNEGWKSQKQVKWRSIKEARHNRGSETTLATLLEGTLYNSAQVRRVKGGWNLGRLSGVRVLDYSSFF